MFPSEVIEQNDASQPVVPEGQGKEEKVTISKTELESLQRQLKETKESERSWADMARRGTAPIVEQPIVEEDDDFDPQEFVDDDAPDVPADDNADKMVADIAATGAQALAKRGYVTAREAQRIAADAAAKVAKELIGRERTKLTTDARIMNDFPELRDPKSDLFRETASRFKEAVAIDPRSAKNPGALYLAARAAKEALEAKKPARRAHDDDFEDEQDRNLRVRSQDSRSSTRAEIDDDDMLGSEAKQVILGMGISQDEYKASRKEMGIGQRRGRR